MARLVFFALFLLFLSVAYSCAPNTPRQNKGNVTPSTTEPPKKESTPNENQQAVKGGPVRAPKVAEKTSTSIVLRVTQNGLHELANFTQQWMSKTIVDIETDTFTHHITKGLGSGSLLFSNTSVEEFAPPTVRYRPSDHSFLYMTAVAGQAKVNSDWTMYSKYLSVLGLPLNGKVAMQLGGIKSEVAMQITATNELLVHHCVARVVQLNLDFSGSYAAEVLHFFRNTLSKSIRRNMEQQFCVAMKDRLVPWLRDQIDGFPDLMRFPISEDVQIIHKLHSISMTNSHIDFRLQNSISWDDDVIEGDAVDYSHFAFADSFEDSSRMAEVFIEEETIQTIASAAHFAEQLRTNVTSPFLRTHCDVMCIGTIFPDLGTSLDHSALRVEVSTVHPPVIRLQNQNAHVALNATLAVFPEPPIENVTGAVLEIRMATEFLLNLKLRNKHFKAYVNVIKSRAEVAKSQIEGVSQKALDFLVNMSTPFLEDAVDVFFGEGLEFADIFKVPLENELLTISEGSVRLQTDIVLEKALVMLLL
ncbi:hypothetical protein QR680_018295 [Steinernema hermaphroditum]|uniref:Lipid-binding serum glycoprotein C-terminal domain-containing protein n=1 Tax=Steinernema hermaphroditum TaxID=289476 RepID=A0AA39LQL8_9BILA|nr:hypothetical protein QR680_018295 [Steinernema hermaphroditum]